MIRQKHVASHEGAVTKKRKLTLWGWLLTYFGSNAVFLSLVTGIMEYPLEYVDAPFFPLDAMT